ncbi:MAG TPA: EAL domain-containing protein, partial [Rubellimicrobium sp.]|nr:EAL domain-containing protein [Rubellimicrobium sp.]
LRRMTPPLLLMMLAAAGLAALGIALARRTAHGLVLAERESATAARTDGLTGLPNRAAFREALAAPARAGQRAILFLDVNGFKRINDSIGHAAGDQVIAELARRLAPLARRGRLLARIGGDEFVVLLRGAEAATQAVEVAREVEEAMAEPFDVLGHELRLGAAVGHAVQATDDMAGDDLLRQADLAMYEAKRHGDRGPVGFDDLIEKAVHDARAVERALRAALDREGEFSIVYQPIAAPEGALAHVEALARWTSPELGTVPPDRFVAVAEQSGLILRLGRVLIRLVCDDLAAHPDLRVSVNISPLQLMAPSFVQDLLADLAERDIDPDRIEVELTESVVVDDPALAAERLGELHAAGFTTALDDFGTGYSSIGYLRQMGFDTLKIDRSFVSGFCESPDRLALVNAMILLAHALGLRVTCEGVETEQELTMLSELGCDLAQGYHLDRPMPIDVVRARWMGPGRAAVA